MHTEMFRQQHKEILEVLGGLGKACLSPGNIDSASGASLRAQLVALSGKVTVHLGSEDRSLYPTLLALTGQPPAKVAEAFSKEMGSLAGAFKQFVGHWPTGDSIAADPATFAQECLGVAKALTNRIDREEKELYPLLDAV